MFVRALDASAQVQRTWQLGTSGDESVVSLAVGPDGTLYLAGSTTGSFAGFTNAGSQDMFLVALDPSAP